MPTTQTPVLVPRNTAVAVVEIKQDSELETEGGILIPKGTGETYSKCEVYAVGRGFVPGGQVGEPESETSDLKPGQTVLVQLRSKQSGVNPMTGRPDSKVTTAGIEFKDEQGRDIILVEQMQIIAIIPDPVQYVHPD